MTFTDEDAAALVACAVEVARKTPTDNRGPLPLAIVCMVAKPDILAVPTALRRMDGAKAVSVVTAIKKAITVLAYDADTLKHAARVKSGVWSEADTILMQGAMADFLPWDGGIVVKDEAGNTLCALAASGRSSEGDRRAMVLAAHEMGYCTNFDEDGYPT